jgi:hypothetical protein
MKIMLPSRPNVISRTLPPYCVCPATYNYPAQALAGNTDGVPPTPLLQAFCPDGQLAATDHHSRGGKHSNPPRSYYGRDARRLFGCCTNLLGALRAVTPSAERIEAPRNLTFLVENKRRSDVAMHATTLFRPKATECRLMSPPADPSITPSAREDALSHYRGVAR